MTATESSYRPPDFTEPRLNRRRGPWRRLTLLDRADRPFLVRRGIDVRLFGIYLHEIAGPDPGLDMHDHPWPFATWVIRGGYSEMHAEARTGTLTLVIRGRKTRPWGFYQVTEGLWVDYREYDYQTRRPVSEVR